MRIILIVLLYLQAASTLATYCEKLNRDVRLFCEAVATQCNSLHSCLVRRDTCPTDGEPKDSNECKQLHQCSQTIDAYYSDHHINIREKCDYQWIKEKKMCLVRKRAFSDQKSCPGTTAGLLRAIINKLDDSTFDKNFNCVAVSNMYRNKLESCNARREEFKKYCISGKHNNALDYRFYKNMEPETCEYHENFSTYQKGAFALTDLTSKEQNLTDRNERSKSGFKERKSSETKTIRSN